MKQNPFKHKVKNRQKFIYENVNPMIGMMSITSSVEIISNYWNKK